MRAIVGITAAEKWPDEAEAAAPRTNEDGEFLLTVNSNHRVDQDPNKDVWSRAANKVFERQQVSFIFCTLDNVADHH